MKGDKLIYGIGINDANYPVYKTLKVDGKKKTVWACPFYSTWKSCFRRCYAASSLSKFPTYAESYVISDWHYFMSFRSWMVEQDWEGKQLDKDLLVPGNRVYSPDTCLFLEPRVNYFLTESKASRGEWPIGVNFDKNSGKFKAQCGDVLDGKIKNLGRFSTPQQAHQAWLDKKIEMAYALPSQQSDPRVAAALIDRYENYEKYFGGCI